VTDDKMTKGLRRSDRFLTAIRSSIDDTIPVQIAHTFVKVCMNPGKGVVELAELTGASKSTMSRHLLDLSETLRTGAPGYGLLLRTVDPTNLRSVVYTLTPRGKLFRNTLADIMED